MVDAGLLGLFVVVFGMRTWLGAAIAFLVSFAFTFTAQRLFAFGSDLPAGSAVLRYTALVAFNTVATALIVGLIARSPLGWLGGKVVATSVTTVWNFFIYRAWIFPPADASSKTETGGGQRA